MKEYMSTLVTVAGIATAALAYLGQKTPLEPGLYPGKINGQPAILQVVYRSEEARDCYLTMRISTGGKENETIEDILCNEKGLSLAKKDQNNTPLTEDYLKDKIKTAKSWVQPDNNVSAEEAQKHLCR